MQIRYTTRLRHLREDTQSLSIDENAMYITTMKQYTSTMKLLTMSLCTLHRVCNFAFLLRWLMTRIIR